MGVRMMKNVQRIGVFLDDQLEAPAGTGVNRNSRDVGLTLPKQAHRYACGRAGCEDDAIIKGVCRMDLVSTHDDLLC